MSNENRPVVTTTFDSSTWIANNYASLPTEEWVAVSENGLLGHHADLDKLIEELEEKQIDISTVCFAFIEAQGPDLIKQ